MDSSAITRETLDLPRCDALAQDSSAWNTRHLLPCTPAQSMLLRATTPSSDCATRHIYRLRESVDLEQFKRSYQKVSDALHALRTTITESEDHGFIRCVSPAPQEIQWTHASMLEQYLDEDASKNFTMGLPFIRCGLVQAIRMGPLRAIDTYFVWTVHHAILDEKSVGLVARCIEEAYVAADALPPPRDLLSNGVDDVDPVAKDKFWTDHFTNMSWNPWKVIGCHEPLVAPDVSVRSQIPKSYARALGFSDSTCIRTALALLLARLQNTEDIVFGITFDAGSGEANDPKRDIGFATAHVPIRIRCTESMTVKELLQQVEDEAAEVATFARIDLHQLSQLSAEAKQACSYPLVLELHDHRTSSYAPALLIDVEKRGFQDVSVRPVSRLIHGLVLDCRVDDRSVSVHLSATPLHMDSAEASAFVDNFQHIFNQITDMDRHSALLSTISAAGTTDTERIWEWNSPVVRPFAATVHSLIESTAAKQPGAVAVDAWDGQVTYSELCTMASVLAQRIVVQGIPQGSVVGLWFNKSKWMSVAMLGAMKAGLLSLAIDVSHPIAHIRGIITQALPRMMLCSSRNSKHLDDIWGSSLTIIAVDDIDYKATQPSSIGILPKVKASDMLYVTYTSGSTGVPKGILISHQNFSSALEHQKRFQRDSRVYDFASYAFDAAWYDAIHTFYAGGCLCVPSDSDRTNNLIGSIRRLKPNRAFLTPAVVKVLEVEFDVLRAFSHLEIGGEIVSSQQLDHLNRYTTATVSYGPSECTAVCVRTWPGDETFGKKVRISGEIGYASGVRTWIVDTTGRMLVPIGSIGELWIEGPMVGQGYLRNPNQSKLAFVECPPWLPSDHRKSTRADAIFYRTGDLARYTSHNDPSLIFKGRIDSQIKFQGQRVELGDVEHHVEQCLEPKDYICAADVLQSTLHTSESLVVFIAPRSTVRPTGEETLYSSMPRLEAHLTHELAKVLPRYMVPSRYILLRDIPLTHNGKVDRKTLRILGESYARNQHLGTSHVIAPITGVEKLLVTVWSEVLNIPETSISIGASFFRLGGSSIAAMQVASRCRARGIKVTTADIMKSRTIERLSSKCKLVAVKEEEAPRSSKSLPEQAVYASLDPLQASLRDMHIDPGSVENVSPCTATQEGMWLSQAQGISSYTATWVLACQTKENSESGSTVALLESAWKRLVARHSILRTIFAEDPETGRPLQVTLTKSPARFIKTASGEEDPSDHLNSRVSTKFSYGEPGSLLIACKANSGAIAIRIDINHLLCDATSLGIIIRDMSDLFTGVNPPSAPKFYDVVPLVIQVGKSSLEFWKHELRGCVPCHVAIGKQMDTGCGSRVKFIQGKLVAKIAEWCRQQDITRATFVQTAWALTLAHLTNLKKVCFGFACSGRDLPIPGIENLAGPLVSLLIAEVDLTASLGDVLQGTALSTANRLRHQYASLAEITHEIGAVSLFNTIVTVRDAFELEDKPRKLGLRLVHQKLDSEFPLAVLAEHTTSRTEIGIMANAHYSETEQFSHVLSTISASVEFMLSYNQSDVRPSDQASRNSANGVSPQQAEGAQEAAYAAFVRYLTGCNETESEEFWTRHLADSDVSHFPSLPSASYVAKAARTQHIRLSKLRWGQLNCTRLSCLQAAFALLTIRNTAVHAVNLGLEIETTSNDGTGVSTPVTVPQRIAVNVTESPRALMRMIEGKALDLARHARIGMGKIQLICDRASLDCEFQTQLSLRSEMCSAEETYNSFLPIALKITCVVLPPEGLHIGVVYDENVLPDVDSVIQQFELALRQCLSETDSTLRIDSLQAAVDHEQHILRSWNSNVPETVSSSIQDMLAHRMNSDNVAVDAWDGKITYSELNGLSNTLARRLVLLGVERNTPVILGFTKSLWHPVAALAVSKAGGTSVSLDIQQPDLRLKGLLHQAAAPVMLCSLSMEMRFAALVDQAFTRILPVGIASCERIPSVKSPNLPNVDPCQALFICFTSGSTGQPKGATITHENVCSALAPQSQLAGITPESRIYDFVSYGFDVAWANLFLTLYAGACLCIPSDVERSDDLEGSLVRYRTTMLILTPSLATSIDFTGITSLRTIIMGGESLTGSELSNIPHHVNLYNVYGTSECTMFSTAAGRSLVASDIGSIGTGLATLTWVVDPIGRWLTPIGGIGELLLEGPLIGSGYLNDPVLTAEKFIEHPSWRYDARYVSSSTKSPFTRMYRTGDLVKRHGDGALVFIRRHDRQRKIRGQRFEIAEVQHHVNQIVDMEGNPESKGCVVVETFTPKDWTSTILGAFIAPPKATGVLDEAMGQTAADIFEALSARLLSRLPRHMIPTVFVACQAIPTTVTGKTDRRRIRRLGESRTIQDLSRTCTAQRHLPSSEGELQLRRLWAEVLGIPDVTSISADDSFTKVGGDSISAMKLVAAARRSGQSLSVVDVLTSPVLSDMAKHLLQHVGNEPEAITPFMLVENASLSELAHDIQGGIAAIMDILPVTSNQLLSLTGSSESTPMWIAYFGLDVHADCETEELFRICQKLTTDFDILRMIFVQHGGRYFQALPRRFEPSISLQHGATGIDELSSKICQTDWEIPLKEGESFIRWFIAITPWARRIILRIPHAQYDGTSMSLLSIAARFVGSTHHSTAELPSFRRFVHQIKRDDSRAKCRAYWRRLLEGAAMSFLPRNQVSRPGPSCTILHAEHQIEASVPLSSNFAVSVIFTAASALLWSQMTCAEDVVIGRVTNGRGTLSAFDQAIVGPCITIIPTRVNTTSSRKVNKELLHQIQSQYVAGLLYEHIDYDDLRQLNQDDPSDWTDFGLVVSFQEVDLYGEKRSAPSFSFLGMRPQVQKSDAIAFLATPHGDILHLSVTAKSSICTEGMLDEILERLAHHIKDTCAWLSVEAQSQCQNSTL